MESRIDTYMRLFLFFFTFCAWGIVTAQSQTLRLDDQTAGEVGEHVTFTLSIDYPGGEFGNIRTIALDIAFDPEVLSYDGYVRGRLVDTWPSFDVDNPGEGQLQIWGFAPTPADGLWPGVRGVIVQLRFLVEAGVDATLTVSAHGRMAGVDTRNGQFRFEPQTCLPDGDVNQDGSVTAADALMALRQAVGLAQLSACQFSSGDVFPSPAAPDGNLTATDALCILQKALGLPSCLDRVPSPNEPPVANAGVDQVVAPGMLVNLSGYGSDPDGTIVGYLWEQTGGTTVSLSGATSPDAAFTAPDVPADEALTFRLTVTDNDGLQASDEVEVTVVTSLPNRPPIVDAGPDQIVEAGSPVFLFAFATDPDGRIVDVLLDQTSGPPVWPPPLALPPFAVTDTEAIFEFVLTAPDVSMDETLTFLFTAVDEEGATGHDTVSVTVEAPGRPGTISGTLRVEEGAVLDGDTNDRHDPVVENNSLDEGQYIHLIPPVSIVGHVNEFDDRQDLYRINLPPLAGIALRIGDWPEADLDIVLADSSGTIIDASMGYEQIEGIRSGADLRGSHIVAVQAAAGASNYVLSIRTDDDGTLRRAVGSGLQLSAEFEASHVVAEFSEDVDAAQLDTLLGVAGDDAAAYLGGAVEFAPTQEVVAGSGPVLLSFQDTLVTLNPTAALAGDSGIGRLRYATPEMARKARLLRAIKRLAVKSPVLYAEPDYIVRASLIPNDPKYFEQQHYRQINLPAAWDITTGSDDIVIAVIDTGVAYHDDLLDRLLWRPSSSVSGRSIVGYDFIRDAGRGNDGDGIDPYPIDVAGFRSKFHGTHVAGTIAAATNNGIGVAGVTWQGKIMPLRVLDAAGEGYAWDIAQGIRYAAGLPNNSRSTPFGGPADIINMSLGPENENCRGLSTSHAINNAIRDALDAGVHVVIAAGNDNCDVPDPATKVDGVIAVSAVDSYGKKASFSNYGRTIDVAAPGTQVLSTMIDDYNSRFVGHTYRQYEGTSMAAPHVAGVLALMLSVNPDLTPEDVNQLLAGTYIYNNPRFLRPGPITQDLGLPGRDDIYGHGLIDAHKAIQAAELTLRPSKPVGQPFLLLNPESLDFGDYRTEMPIHVSNGATGGRLTIGRITTDRSWLLAEYHDVSAPFVNVRVDRTVLPPGLHSGHVTISSNAGERTVDISVLMPNLDRSGNVGTVYLLVVNPDTLEPVAQVMTNAAQRYAYQTPQVPGGSYIVIAGTDRDGDGLICDTGEACGMWPAIDSRQPVDVDGDLSGIDIPVWLDLAAGPDEPPLAEPFPEGIAIEGPEDPGRFLEAEIEIARLRAEIDVLMAERHAAMTRLDELRAAQHASCALAPDPLICHAVSELEIGAAEHELDRIQHAMDELHHEIDMLHAELCAAEPRHAVCQ